jgi:hypothetical protein
VRALLLLALVSIACSGDRTGSCPGELVGTFTLQGTLDDARTRCDVEPPDQSFDAFVQSTATQIGPFAATLAQSPTDAATRPAALCTGVPLASPYFGARQPDGTYVLDAPSGAAVLAPCGATCSTTSHELVTGVLTYVDGRPVSFDGTLQETFDYRGGDCTKCAETSGGTPVVHCVATYVLTTVP